MAAKMDLIALLQKKIFSLVCFNILSRQDKYLKNTFVYSVLIFRS